MTTEEQACEVPLVEQLRSIPDDYRTVRAIQWSEDGRETGHQFIPVGFMMHRAAAELERLQEFQRNVEETEGRCCPEDVGFEEWIGVLTKRLALPAEARPLTDWLRENAPDCGDNSCLFGGRGKGGMRTNGGCRCFKDVRPEMKRIFIERMYAALLAASPQGMPK